MIKLTKTAAGEVHNTEHPVYDSTGTGRLPIQAKGDGATTFKVMGKVAEEADWIEIIAAGTADFLQSIDWCPYLQLVVTAGAGMVTLWIGEK